MMPNASSAAETSSDSSRSESVSSDGASLVGCTEIAVVLAAALCSLVDAEENHLVRSRSSSHGAYSNPV